VENCGYCRGHSGQSCGRPVGTESVIRRRPQHDRDSSTRRPHPETRSDLRTRRFSTVSTGAKNTMESVERSQSTKRTGGPIWGKPRSRVDRTDLSGCSRNDPQYDADATRPKPAARPKPPELESGSWIRDFMLAQSALLFMVAAQAPMKKIRT